MLNRSPSQRFYRTRNQCMSPNINRVYDSPKYNSPRQRIGYTSASPSIANSPNVRSSQANSQKSQNNQKIQDRISSLQKMLQNQKCKRQTQFTQLFSMISSIKNGNHNMQSVKQVNFGFGEHQFPMTPRIKGRDSGAQTQRQMADKNKSYQTYTPIYQTISKNKDQKIKKCENVQELFFNQSNGTFSIKSLQFLLQKIQKDTESNNLNISKIQEEIFSIKSSVAKQNIFNQKTIKAQQVPIQIQRFVRDQCRILKNQLQMQRHSFQSNIYQQITQKFEEKFKDFQHNTANSKYQRILQEQINKVYMKLGNISQFFNQQVRSLEDKTANQIYTLNDIIQQKIRFFRQSLVDQMLKSSNEETNQLRKFVQNEKIRIDEIQEQNKLIFDQFQKTMANIQQKLRAAKSGSGGNHYEKQRQQIFELMNKQKQILRQQLLSQINIKLRQNIGQITPQIRNLLKRIQKIQDKIIPPPISKLTKNYSISSTQKSLCAQETPSPQSAYYTQSQIPYQNDISFQCPIGMGSMGNMGGMKNENKLQNLSQQLSGAGICVSGSGNGSTGGGVIKYEQIMQVVNQNCSYLESRNVAIQESIGQVVWVLNGIVQKMKNFM